MLSLLTCFAALVVILNARLQATCEGHQGTIFDDQATLLLAPEIFKAATSTKRIQIGEQLTFQFVIVFSGTPPQCWQCISPDCPKRYYTASQFATKLNQQHTLGQEIKIGADIHIQGLQLSQHIPGISAPTEQEGGRRMSKLRQRRQQQQAHTTPTLQFEGKCYGDHATIHEVGAAAPMRFTYPAGPTIEIGRTQYKFYAGAGENLFCWRQLNGESKGKQFTGPQMANVIVFSLGRGIGVSYGGKPIISASVRKKRMMAKKKVPVEHTAITGKGPEGAPKMSEEGQMGQVSKSRPKVGPEAFTEGEEPRAEGEAHRTREEPWAHLEYDNYDGDEIQNENVYGYSYMNGVEIVFVIFWVVIIGVCWCVLCVLCVLCVFGIYTFKSVQISKANYNAMEHIQCDSV